MITAIIVLILFSFLVEIWIKASLNGITMTFGRSRCKIRILYRSGNVQEMWFLTFNWSRAANGDNSLEWKEYYRSEQPMKIGVDDIEAIFQIGTKVSIWRYFPGISKTY